MSVKTSTTEDTTMAPPQILREGDAVAFQIDISGVVSTLASPTMTFWKDGGNSDKSSTYFTGSMTVSGIDTIITKTTQNLKAGSYVMSISATVDGQVQNVTTVPVIVKRQGQL